MKNLLTAASIILAVAGVSATAQATPCGEPITGWNFDVPAPVPTAASNFDVFLPGNQLSCVTGNYNSFPSGTFTVTYDSTHKDTVLKFFSSTSATVSTAAHFGFSGFVPGGSGGEKLPPLQMTWTYPTHKPVKEPLVGIRFKNDAIGVTTKYFVIYVLSAFPGAPGATTANWFEFPYQGNYSYNFVGSGGGVTLSDAQFFTSPTQIPLDQLNVMDTPPNSGSFQTIPGYPQFIPSAVPEPAAFSLLGLGLLALASARIRRH